MAEQKTIVHSTEGTIKRARAFQRSTFRMKLGDLRQFIEAAEHLPDEANFWVELASKAEYAGGPKAYYVKEICSEVVDAHARSRA